MIFIVFKCTGINLGGDHGPYPPLHLQIVITKKSHTRLSGINNFKKTISPSQNRLQNFVKQEPLPQKSSTTVSN